MAPTQITRKTNELITCPKQELSFNSQILRRQVIAKNRNTYAKRQREAEKKAKAEAKRVRRNKLKQSGPSSYSAIQPDSEPEFLDDSE
ncbi:hypothetical protein [Gimesia panareensis]|uniref:hypothetical protein n=1 Tax=Gimesia panareensis TaxID=2527978 RepID=UPI00119DE0CF|nr:hypothetical protein [Gimesia panareensis]